ncbi:aminotransferase-like domain-containing protein [Parachitinimonas caeni]|uniref:Putative 8-amino-7-oxononanoate synthase n=1 Tax=Parachitinimonas caeni TaxID=3031301 RepID=A0ABT7DZF1_9NEIS|nr:PLP-dependent aminotransferase family protein [Parachitinimonas caeni]MDK2125428.1 PLP-dependent aminotransferase family protein [Parachitinimonas caeni]
MCAAITDTMNLLNEATRRYPAAISFLAGRPPQHSVDAMPATGWLQHFIEHSHATPAGRQQQWTELGQYSDTNGVVREHVARYLQQAGFAGAEAASCLISNGAQEAMAICLAGLAGRDKVAFAPDPCYVGFAGAADAMGVALETALDDAQFLDRLQARLEGPGKPIGCVYVIPDFANPSTRVMTLAERQRLLAMAAQYDFFIVEDAAYRQYRYEGTQLPAIKQLDQQGRVVYIESFAKSVLPGLRLAVLLADHQDAQGTRLAQRLSSIKSYLSVATSPITQAMLAGLLQQEAYSLERWIAPRRNQLAANRDALVAALIRHFGPSGQRGIRWQIPEGGFFLALDLPFEFGQVEFECCMSQHQVLVMPMQAFSTVGNQTRQIRLAFSNADADTIERGVERLARFIETKLAVAEVV